MKSQQKCGNRLGRRCSQLDVILPELAASVVWYAIGCLMSVGRLRRCDPFHSQCWIFPGPICARFCSFQASDHSCSLSTPVSSFYRVVCGISRLGKVTNCALFRPVMSEGGHLRPRLLQDCLASSISSPVCGDAEKLLLPC